MRLIFFISPFAVLRLFFATQMKMFNNHGGSCQPHVCEFALYFVMEHTNLGDLCLKPSIQTEILLNVWRGKDVRHWSSNLANWILGV